MKIRKTGVFKKWLKKLRDNIARSLILTRIDRLEEGNPGDNRFLGDISEMRINYGPGYRIYYKDTGNEIIILLCGGDKSTQQADIAKASSLLHLWIFCMNMQKIPIIGAAYAVCKV